MPKTFDPEKPDLLHATGTPKPRGNGKVWLFLLGAAVVVALLTWLRG